MIQEKAFFSLDILCGIRKFLIKFLQSSIKKLKQSELLPRVCLFVPYILIKIMITLHR